MKHPITLSPDEQAKLVAAVRARSVTEVSRDVGVSREVVAKLAAGLSARAGGVAIVRAALSTLTEAFTPTAA